MALLLESYGHRPGLFSWIQVTARVLAGVLVAGFLTPFAAILALATHGLIWCLAGISSALIAAVVCLDAGALALLGPGDYSVDSYRFGRRVVVLPPT
jgi:4-amino-4-deoxy-L-arabinose transferase-like glycosyltransferase